MAEFRLERFKYNWRGDWVSDVSYKRDDVIRVGGKSYVCLITHVSSNIFRTDLNAIVPGSNPPLPEPRWGVMTNSTSFVGDWAPGTDYNLGDVVLFNGSLYLCVIDHSAITFGNDANNWVVFSSVTNFDGEWLQAQSYGISDIVSYGGNLYKCLETHDSQDILEDDSEKWEVYLEGISWKNTWTSDTVYAVNDLIKYGPTVFRCVVSHTSSESFNNDNFEVEFFGYQYENSWNEDVNYNVGDIVRHDGFVYYAVNNNYQSRPYADNGSPDWILLFKAYNFKGTWTADSIYKTGDVVLRGGQVFLAKRDIADGQSVDGSTLDYLEEDTWELLIPGKSWKANWNIGNVYSVGDVVYFRGNSFTCNFEHESSFQNFPGDNGSGFYYWDSLINSGNIGGLQTKGDLLTFGQSRQFDDDGSTIFDDSTFGDTAISIGQSEQLLSVSSDLEAFWRDITEDAESIFVAANGIDDTDRGTFEKPFASIRYASQYVQENFEAGSPVIIRVGTGKFNEVSPIVVPAGCAINGDELRSTTVLANGPLPQYQNDYPYLVELLNRFTSIMGNIVTATESTPTVGNTETQITELLVLADINDTDGQSIGGENFKDEFPQGSIDKIPEITTKFSIYKNYIEFYIADGEVNPELEGSNTLNQDQEAVDTIEAVYINRRYLATELWAQLSEAYPNETFSLEKIKTDVYALISGIRRDIQYSGNYGTLNAAKVYANSVNGSKSENLFLMRDSTGLRDMTTGGLEGILNPPGVFDLYQKPTGGALVALDPGWGPEDERTWITKRSPYIQGVTNTGFACVGMKVDGALHNGGNASMTANDFTQVLSDGIGAWITNNARAELVSVFTYYCQVGYFAEDGGIIRSANGNNSYGKYGSISDGVDETEIPQSVQVFNRNNQAEVLEAFAGGTSDELLAFEYINTGQNYTSATATIVGAGSNAQIEYTEKSFNDDAIFEVRLASPDGSSSGNGAGYLRRQGSAQEIADASSEIKLAVTDVTQFFSEIDGMRIVITSGLGVGQYGYITDFNFATKTVTVTKESDDTLGWDHIIPGTPLVSTFDLTTTYRIEPRVEISEPSYDTSTSNLFTNRSYVDVAFGTITESYTGVTAGGNVIWRDDNLNRVVITSIISNVSLQFRGDISSLPQTPLNIRGRTSGTQATITNFSANVQSVIEVDISGSGSSFIEGEEIDLLFLAGTGDTFDGDPSASEFSILRKGQTYEVTVTNPGSGYSVDDKITILGTQLGGATPKNDLTITITEVSDDSTSSILEFDITGIGRGGRFVSLTSSEYARYSDDGTTWTETSLPFIGSYVKLIANNDRFFAISQNNNRIARSLNGATWDTISLPLDLSWSDGVFGSGKYVIIANDDDRVLYSTDGENWNVTSIPNDTDGGIDSTTSLWQSITYGAGKFIAVSSSDEAVAVSDDGITWTRYDSALPSLFTATQVEYGNNRFVSAGAGGETAYSFDGITWYSGDDVSANDPLITVPLGNNFLKYANGMFIMLIDFGGPGSVFYSSQYGKTWRSRALGSTKDWSALAYGNNNWVMKASNATTDAVSLVKIGATAFARAEQDVGTISEIRIINPGSGYITDPVVTVTDPNATVEVAPEARIGNGSLAQPDFINRGSGYRRSTSIITVSGDGFADVLPIDDKLTISGVTAIPGPGVQIEIDGVEDPNALEPGTLAVFTGATVTDLGDDGTGNETRLVEFRISPRIGVEYVIPHGTPVTLRENFSQCRISGHDFLDIGTGNFEQTNYPTVYADGEFFRASPENEVYENNGGRVYYVSTDQDGNFRTGELFSVQQATGIVTISAQFFDLDGLSELALGGVRLGGSGAVVNEFSSDPTFAADSNNVVPTQRAIASFLADRLSVGGESLEVNKLQAGRVLVGGPTPDTEFNTVTGQYLIIPSDVVFDGTFEADDGAGNITTEQTSLSGTIVSQMLYFKQFDETMQ